jgi:hypothetical protein
VKNCNYETWGAADLISVEIIAGETINSNKETTPVKPGDYVTFLGTHQRQIYDRECPDLGRLFRMMLCDISGRGFKRFAYENIDSQDIDFLSPTGERNYGYGRFPIALEPRDRIGDRLRGSVPLSPG